MSAKEDTSKQIICGLIYSKFENIGPTAIAWYPNLDHKYLSSIALKSLNLFTAEEGKVPESISVIPFSFIHRIGIVKCFEIPDETARGRARDATLTLLVDENYNNLILRYIDDISNLLDNITGRILVNEQINASKDEIKRVITESFAYIIDNIEVFQALEKERMEYEPKIEHLKAMISEIEAIIEEYIKDMDKFGTNEVKDVLRLAWDIKQIDLYNISPEEIRQVLELANRLKIKKESIRIQKKKLKYYKGQMTKESIEKLDKHIEIISKNLEKFINKLFEIIKELAQRSEEVIKSQSKKKKKKRHDFLFQKQFAKIRNDLKHQFDLFSKIERLPPERFQIVKETYLYLEKMRALRRNKEIGKAAETISKIIKVDRNQILKATRDPKIKEDFSKIFQLGA
ncbi:MAG: hypothetical protein ACTSYB_10840 [Candidatus Helarchaeota archaeon]